MTLPFWGKPRCALERQRRSRVIKIGAKVILHDRYVTFQLTEVAVQRGLFRKILSLTEAAH